MRKWMLLALILTATMAFNVTLDEAQKVALKYIKLGETIDIRPPVVTKVQGYEFWVFDVISQGKVITLIPVDANKGIVVSSSDAKDAMQIHYGARFFTESELYDWLENLKATVQNMQVDFENRKKNYLSLKAQLNTTLINAPEFENTLENALSDMEQLRASIVKAGAYKTLFIQDAQTLEKAKKDIQEVFSKEEMLLNELDMLNDRITALVEEISEKVSNGEIDPNLGSALQQVVNIPLEQRIVMRDDLQENEQAFNSVFEGISQTVDTFTLRLDERIRNKERLDILSHYKQEYEKLINESKSLPGWYVDEHDIGGRLKDLYNTLNDFYEDSNRTDFETLEDLIASLEADIEGYAPECTNGEMRECTVDGKKGYQTCIQGRWGSCKVEEHFSPNYGLIVGGIILIGFLVWMMMRKRKGSEKEEYKYGQRWV